MLKLVWTITALCVVLSVSRVVESRSLQTPPEVAAREKAEFCEELGETEKKLPKEGNLVDRLTRVRTTMCNDPKWTRGDLVNELYDGLENTQHLEIGITWLGVQGYCDQVLSQSTLWRKSDLSRVNAADVKDQEYLDFQELCTSSLTTPQELVPAFQALQNKFYI